MQEQQQEQARPANSLDGKEGPLENEPALTPAVVSRGLNKRMSSFRANGALSPVCEGGMVRVRATSMASCSTLGANDAEFDEEFGDVRASRPPLRKEFSVMTNITKKYDLTGKGYLDDAEKAMRALDTDNAGTLDMQKVYLVMKDMQEQQKELHEQQKNFSNLKKVVIVLACFSMILAIANLGTAFAAATLAKDTKVDSSSGALLAKGSGEMISTVSSGSVVRVWEPTEIENIYDRHLRVSRRAIVVGRLGGEPQVLNCPHPALGVVEANDVMELRRNINRGVSNLDIKYSFVKDGTGAKISADLSLHIEESNYDEMEDKLHIRATRTIACTENDTMCSQYRLAPEDFRFEPYANAFRYGLYSCDSESHVFVDGEGTGLGEGGL